MSILVSIFQSKENCQRPSATPSGKMPFTSKMTDFSCVKAALLLILRVLPLNPILVISAGDVFYPILVIEIPLNGFADAGFEGFSGFPAKFAVDFGGIDGVAAVVAGTVGDISDLFGVGFAIGSRREFVENRADFMNHIEVGLLVPSTDVVGLPYYAGFENPTNGRTMVTNVEPIANLLAVTINRKRLACESVVYDKRNEFFGEMVGAVVVGTICCQDGQAVGVMVSTDEVVTGGLAGGIGAVRLVGVGFFESGVLGRERSIDFVGRDMQEAKGFFIPLGKTAPIGSGGFQEMKCADDIGLDKLARAVNRTIYMRLSGKIDDGSRLVLREKFDDEGTVTNIASHKDVVRIALERSQILKVSRVGKLVEIDDGCRFRFDPIENEVGADKAGAASDEDGVFHKGAKVKG